MDWLKRNWVDVLMGGLIFAIAAGVLVVLLRGGLFVSSNPTNANSAAIGGNAAIAVPGISANSVNTTTAPGSQTVSIAVKPIPTKPTAVKPTSTKSIAVKPVTPRVTASLSVPEIPDAPSGETAVPKTTPTQAITLTKPVQAAKPSQSMKPPVPAQSNATQVDKLSQSGNYSRADFLRNYRIAAGSYTRLERAIRAVSALRSKGLPAQQFSSGNTYVVVVGPYAREASARSALLRVRQTLPDAILYRPDGSKEGVAKKPVPSQQKQGGGGSGAITLSAVSYLQVGAFKDSGSASGLLKKLKNAGFVPLTKNISGLLRVLVGPLQPSQLETTRTTLKNQGFDAFPILL
jgi:cell division septation protein DedD